MDKLTMHSPDMTEQNIDKLLALFPNCKTEKQNAKGELETAIDFDLLKQELSKNIVEGLQERYQLNWPGKKEALLTANAPIAKSLRPCRDESVNFDTTENLLIEGDNLDALKLLQETYLGKVKMIYIDPPYNTGKDFIYADNFAESTEEYLQDSGQKDDVGNRLVANTESNGRFHSDWLSMMYSRLKLSRNLLKDSGVIFVSIDSNEVKNLRKILDEIYGEENFLIELIWEKTRKNDAKFFSDGHEYIVVYSKNKSCLKEQGIIFREEKDGAQDIYDEYVTLRKKHGDNFDRIEKDLKSFYQLLSKSDPAKKHSRYNKVDDRGVWRDDNMSWPGGNGPKYDLIHPVTGQPCAVPPGGWRFSTLEKMQDMIDQGVVVFRDDHTEPPIRKTYLARIGSDGVEDLGSQVMGSYFYKSALSATNELNNLLGSNIFENPKDHNVIARLVKYVCDEDSVILDFFAGSGTTAQSVMEVNSSQNKEHQYILIQLPEGCDEKSEAFKAGYKTIAEISKERIRRAGAKIKADNPESTDLDIGFRVLKIDSSNMNEVHYTPDALDKDDLFNQVEHIKPDRSAEDLLFQVMLDWGVDLSLPISKQSIEGKDVYFVNDSGQHLSEAAPCDLAACFEKDIDEALIKALAAKAPLRVVFRDDGFISDSVKINVEQIFKQLAPATDIKVI